jgi:hypothetical protein
MTDADLKKYEAILQQVNFPYELDLSPTMMINPTRSISIRIKKK